MRSTESSDWNVVLFACVCVSYWDNEEEEDKYEGFKEWIGR